MRHPISTSTTLGSGPTVSMLHDIGGSHLSFAPQVERFAMFGWWAVAWNMPDYGRSAPVEPYNCKAITQSCAAVIDALQVPQGVTLIGYGIGGMVAQELLARQPEVVERLTLCGAPARVGMAGVNVDEDQPVNPWQRDYLALHAPPPDAAGNLESFAATRVVQLTGSAALPEGERLAGNCMTAVNLTVRRHVLEASLGFNRSAELELICVPTLLIAGKHDAAALPALLADMANRIDGSIERLNMH